MDPHSSDFTETGFEPRQSPESGNGLRRLALLLPLVAAVPISIAVLSQNKDDSPENESSAPPVDLTPVAGLNQPESTPEPEPAAAETPENKPEIADLAEMARDLEERDRKEGENEGADAKKEENLQAEADAAAKAEKPDAEAKKPADQPKIAEVKKPEPAPAKPARPSQIEVKSGDTLYSLGRRFNVPAEAIARENGINVNDTIRRGQVLKIPTEAEAKRLMAAAPPAPTRTQTPPPGPVPYPQRPLTPVSAQAGTAAAAPQTGYTNHQTIPTQPTNQPQATVATTTTTSRPTIGVNSRNRTSKPRPNDSQAPAVQTQTSSTNPNSQWPHANGQFVPSDPGAASTTTPTTGANATVPSARLQPVRGSFKPGKYIVYRVQPNDTLPSIAAGHSTTVGLISDMNGGLQRAQSGQVLIIPVDAILREVKKN